MATYKNNRWKTGGNKRVLFRTGTRRAKNYGPFFFGAQSLGANTVRSINTLLARSPGAKLARAIEKERKKVVKRMAELIAEGYDFDFDEFRDIWTGNVKHSRKQLERLKQLGKRALRRYASSYKGITDKLLMKQMYDAEVQQKKMRNKMIKEAKKAAEQKARDEEMERIRREEAAKDEELLAQLPYDLDIKVNKLLRDEEKYILTCEEFVFLHPLKTYRQKQMYERAIRLANECIDTLQRATDEEKQKVIDFIETHGNLSDMIQMDFYVLFYDIPNQYNDPFLMFVPITGQQEMEMDAIRVDARGFLMLEDLKPSTFDDDDFLPQ